MHIPEPRRHLVRYYGRYSNVCRGKRIPYSVVRYLNHLGSFVLPLLALVVVLLKVLPLVFKIWFNLQMQRRLIQLGNIEKRYAAGDDRSSLSAELDRVDQATAKLFVPRAGAHDYVDFDITIIWDRIQNPRPDIFGVVPEQDDYRLVFFLGFDL